MGDNGKQDLARKNRKILNITLGVVFGMVLLSFASVPLYRLTCQVMGWGGTTQMVEANPNTRTYDRAFTVKFNTNVAQGMPWAFRPDIRETVVKAGQDGFISFVAENKGQNPVTGTAVYNVTPLQAGKYFYKTQCFCFGEQVLNPGEKVHMPVVFFVDPAIMEDKDLAGLSTITLSYTFFKKDSPELEKAMEKFYTDHGDSKT